MYLEIKAHSSRLYGGFALHNIPWGVALNQMFRLKNNNGVKASLETFNHRLRRRMNTFQRIH